MITAPRATARTLLLLFAIFATTGCAMDDPLPTEPVEDHPLPLTDVLAPDWDDNPSTTTTSTTVAPSTTTTSTTTTTTTSTTTTTTTAQAYPGAYRATVEVWRDEVQFAISYWGGNAGDVDRFLRIMECESGGDPLAKNPTSSASGLMQHLTRYWDERAAAAGMPDGDVFDGRTNIYVSAWLALAAPGGGWQHWVCR
jgi:hypothetical protein